METHVSVYTACAPLTALGSCVTVIEPPDLAAKRWDSTTTSGLGSYLSGQITVRFTPSRPAPCMSEAHTLFPSPMYASRKSFSPPIPPTRSASVK